MTYYRSPQNKLQTLLRQKTKLEALVQATSQQRMHVVNSFFILGMAEKTAQGQLLTVAEVSALDQFYDYYIEGIGRE